VKGKRVKGERLGVARRAERQETQILSDSAAGERKRKRKRKRECV
jgi:hypothetical protein